MVVQLFTKTVTFEQLEEQSGLNLFMLEFQILLTIAPA
jgi:hypothetical protein